MRVDKRLVFYDVRKLMETTQPGLVATSYAAVVKTSTNNVSVNSDLTWRHNEIHFENTDTDKQVIKPTQR